MRASAVLLCMLVLVSPAAFRSPAHRRGSCAASVRGVDRNRIWVDLDGAGTVTVVFEAGFGNESSVWSAITPQIRAAGARTFVYDGGAISLVAASDDDRITGVVLIEAVVPGAWPQSEVDKNLATMRSQYAEVRQQAPALAKVAIPWAEAMPATARRIDAVRVPDGLPIIDIVADHGMNNPESAKVWQAAHARFTANEPSREHVLAAGSSHKVMADQPGLVVRAILEMLRRQAKR